MVSPPKIPDTIKILGGGIAGLTAAVNLKRAGIPVEVHERKSYCGKRINDFQFLENWTFDEDALDILRKIHIRPAFYIKAQYSQEAVSPSGNRYVGTSIKPVMYLVKRGKAEDTIDHCLESHCRELGVDLVFDSTLKVEQANIIATGIKRPTFIAAGVIFSCDFQDRSILLFDNNLSAGFYSYFIANDNIGEIVCVNPVGIKDHRDRLDLTVDRFEGMLKIKVNEVLEKFSAPVNFDPLSRACGDGRYFVGEAAGFQDCLMGFGMLHAFKSGYLAAKSIIEGSDYQRLLESEILGPIKISVANRLLYEKLSNQGYERLIGFLNSGNPIIRSLLGGKDLRRILNKLYNRSLPHLLRALLLR